jgi:two-component system response regulator HydG
MSTGQQPRRHKTLLVDDDPSLLDALERAFAEAGEDVAAFGSFEEARRALQTTPFDALITDVRLGEFNGLQLAVIARDTYPDIRVIVFSGYDDPVLRTEAEHVHATYLVKPVAGAKLLALLRQPAGSVPAETDNY